MPKSKSARAPAAEALLVELLTEELPPKSLAKLSLAFADALADHLRDAGFIGGSDEPRAFATPRRLAVLVPNVRAQQPDRVSERKGPSVQAALDAQGKPTKALIGFARACGVGPERLERRTDEKGEYFVYRAQQKGAPLAARLAGFLEEAIKRLPVARLMRWGAGEAQFVRPVHGLVMLHGSRVVPGEVLGLTSGNRTCGHRFMSKGPLVIKRARDYEKTLHTRGNVIASFEERRDVIVRALDKAAVKTGNGFTWRLGREMDLIDEVTSIVESPGVHAGSFDAAFLEVPRECLIVTMQQHQKYFPLADGSGRLQPRFLFVANTQPRDAREIVHGNERVLRARLADAKFFYDQDRRTPLAERVPRLAGVVYQQKLGTQLERVERLKKLAGDIARMLPADPAAAERAAHLCKADLLTDMVGEFPELQGVMGRYYALHDGEPPEIADAVAQHYMPRAAGGELPQGPVAMCVALADKLETLTGIFGIGQGPTGEKDPFGLRRAAIGVLRLLIEKALPLDIDELLEGARARFTHLPAGANVGRELQDFLFDRLRSYLRERGYAADEIEAVLALRPTRLDQVLPRLDAVRTFRAAPEGLALAAANKRIQNILRQAGDGDPDKITPAIDGALFQEEAEKELARRLAEVATRVRPLTAAGDFAGALKELSGLRSAVDTFFDRVLVMADDPNLRMARLQLLATIRREFREIADISRLQGQA